MNFISRGIRNAFRNTIRTISIVIILGLSIGLSLTMLIAHQAVGDKITSVKASVGNTVSVSPAGVRGFEGGGNPLTQTQITPIEKLPNVVSVTQTLSDRLTSSDTNLQSSITAGSLGQRFAQNSGNSFTPPAGIDSNRQSTGGTFNFTPPVTVTGTTNPSNLSSNSSLGGGTFTITSGTTIDGNSSDNVAIVGKDLASKNNLKVGSTFTAYGTTVTVKGIYDAGNTFANSQLVMPLATIQKLSNQPGALTSVSVQIDSISNVSSATTAIQKQLGSAADVTNAAQTAQNTIAPLQNIQSISLYSLIGAVIAGSVIILLTMIMIVRERRREIGVLKAIGASNLKVMGQFMAEAITFTALAAVIGIVLGFIAGNPITRLLVTNSTSSTRPGGFGSGGGVSRGFGFVRNNFSTIHASIGWSIILYGLVAALLIAIIGSSLASFFIAKIRPAEVMRSE